MTTSHKFPFPILLLYQYCYYYYTHREQTSLKLIQGDKLIGWGFYHSGCLFVVAYLLLCTGNAGVMGTRLLTDWTRITAVFQLCSSPLNRQPFHKSFIYCQKYYVFKSITFIKFYVTFQLNASRHFRRQTSRPTVWAGAEHNLTSDHHKRSVYETADRTAFKANYYPFLGYIIINLKGFH